RYQAGYVARAYAVLVGIVAVMCGIKTEISPTGIDAQGCAKRETARLSNTDNRVRSRRCRGRQCDRCGRIAPAGSHCAGKRCARGSIQEELHRFSGLEATTRGVN